MEHEYHFLIGCSLYREEGTTAAMEGDHVDPAQGR